MSVCVCVCLCMGGGDSWLRRLGGSMGATFCHLAALRSAIEFLFWDHGEMAQILAGRSREVTGANFCHLAAPRPPIEFLLWDQQMVWASSRQLTSGLRIITVGGGQCKV